MFTRPPDHEKRMEQMRRRAEWELGNASWAGVLFAAYESPDEDRASMQSDADDDLAATSGAGWPD